MIIIFLILAALLLAYSNGANDNFKGVATLYGSKVLSYRGALVWATLTVSVGSGLALYGSEGLVAKFSGKGLVSASLVGDPVFLTAVAAGAGFTVLFATFLGLPVSTTHALVGGLAGAGWAADPAGLQFSSLLKGYLAPLLFSPVAAAFLTVLVYFGFRWIKRRSGLRAQDCLCVQIKSPVYGLSQSVAVRGVPQLKISACPVHPEIISATDGVLAIRPSRILNILHGLSSGAVGVSRGWNDTPKIAALILGLSVVDPRLAILVLAIFMAVGGWHHSPKLAKILSKKITTMNPGQAFTANMVTAVLVLGACLHAMPVSTTHVSVGALFGLGLVTGRAQWGTIRTILLAWILTLPVGALLGYLIYQVIS